MIQSVRTVRRVAERGQGLVEYALALVMVSIVVIVVLALTGTRVRTVFCDIVYQMRTSSAAGLSSCPDPHITIAGIDGSRTPKIEAIVQDDEGNGDSANGTTNIDVTFTLTGPTPISITEHNYHFCLNGTDSPCGSVTLSPGTYSLVVVATDQDGNVNQTSISFVVK